MDCFEPNIGSKQTTCAAIKMALAADRNEEKQLQSEFAKAGISACAVDFGGDFIGSIPKIIERAVVAAKREKLIAETMVEEGAVAGAAREALSQMMTKAIGLNVGGKIGIARGDAHVAVSLYFGIGLLHLNEVGFGLGHRVV